MLSNKGDNERRIICPYEPSHILLHYRMQTHLVKCRRNHPDQGVTICMFNAVHQIPTPELAYHYEVCPDRGNIDRYAIATEDVNPDRFAIEQPDIVPEDSWDDAAPTATYNPEDYCRNNVILRNNVIHTQSAAKRRDFRLEERQRIQELMNQQTTNRPGTSRQEVAHRRPVGASEGLQNRAELVDNDPFDVANLLAKVNLGSSTLTTPRLNTSNTVETVVEKEKEQKVSEGNDESASSTQHSFVGNGSTAAVRSTGAVPRTQSAAANSREQRPLPSWPIVGSSAQNGSSRSTGWKPPVTNCVLDEQNFPQLGAPGRSAMARNGTNVSRGRGSRLAKK